MIASCDCATGAGFNYSHDRECPVVRARLFPAPPAESAELVSWVRFGTDVDVIWRDQEEINRRAALSVDEDIDGLTFARISGDDLPEDEDVRDELLASLESDMAALRGSEFIPIRAWHHRAHRAHAVSP